MQLCTLCKICKISWCSGMLIYAIYAKYEKYEKYTKYVYGTLEQTHRPISLNFIFFIFCIYFLHFKDPDWLKRPGRVRVFENAENQEIQKILEILKCKIFYLWNGLYYWAKNAQQAQEWLITLLWTQLKMSLSFVQNCGYIVPANRRFLCVGVPLLPYTAFLCYRGLCSLALLMFQVWTWIFSLSKKTDRPLSPFSPNSVLQLGSSSLQMCSLSSRGRQICSRHKYNQNFWDITRTVTCAGSGSKTRLERFTKSSKQWQGEILHSVRNLGMSLYIVHSSKHEMVRCWYQKNECLNIRYIH